MTLAMRLRVRRRAAALLLLAVVLALPQGCASRWRAAQERASSPLPRGTLPEALAAQPIAVLPFVNATGQPLRMPQGLLTEASRAVGRTVAEPSTTVPDRLQERAGVELERRGFRVVPLEQVRAAVPHALEPPLAGAGAAASAGLDGPVLVGTLRRFTVTESGLLLVRLELALVDAKRQEILWTGIAKRPVPIQSALTWQEILLDAGGPIFAEAFGSP